MKVIDDHHFHLFNLLNKMFADSTSAASQETINTSIDQLVYHAKYHFITEEYWMFTHKYPALTEHREEHQIFANRVTEIQKKFYNGETNLYPEMLQFLQNWLSHHILKTDAEYVQFTKGVSHDAN